MTQTLDAVELESAREMEGRSAGLWTRRLLLLLLAVLPVLALFNVFGQTASEAKVSSPQATLTVRSPTHARGGLLYEARFTIQVHQDIKQATLNLGGGWANGLTINTIEPSPSQEQSQHGELSLQLGDLSAGDTYVLHMQFQVNPTTVGSRAQQVALLAGNTPLLSLSRHLTVWP